MSQVDEVEEMPVGEIADASSAPSVVDEIMDEINKKKKDPKRNRRIPKEEIFNAEIMNILQNCHAVFYQFYRLGRPCFTDSIPTAAVGFDKKGRCVQFLFNYDFWESLNNYERAFIIAHECLHVILNHGKRGQEMNQRVSNLAMDVSINHTLVECFRFHRDKIRGWENYCWKEKFACLKDEIHEPIRNFEYYYQIMMDEPDLEMQLTYDIHNFADMTDEELQEVLEKMGKSMTLKEIAELRERLSRTAGTSPGNKTFLLEYQQTINRKWESVITNWAKRFTQKKNLRWDRKPKRMSILPDELSLPYEQTEEIKRKKKIRLKFGLDTSGSCVGLKERFFKAACSLDLNCFEIEAFCFDTEYYPINLKDGELKGFGGTSFHQIEEEFIKEEEDGKPYPAAVFILTDGMGTPVHPKLPERWHWFLTDPYLDCIPSESYTYDLNEYC